MTNHVHLIVVPSTESGLADMMQSLGRKYVQYANRVYNRSGTMWEGRFKSGLVGNDDYLIACSVYIESNPVRANMVSDPGAYPWSSYQARAKGKKDPLLDNDPAYSDLATTDKERRIKYRSWFNDRVPLSTIDLIRSATQRGGIVGDASFIEKVARITSRDVVLRRRGRPKNHSDPFYRKKYAG